MTDTTGTIQSKGLDGTGITEEIASELFNKVGTHVMAIVDLQVVDKAGPNLKGKRKVTFVIDGIEPATDDSLAEHLRELQRTVYLNRKHSDGQLAIDQELAGDEPTVEGVIAAGQSQRPHPFLPVDASEENPLCDVCGLIETAPRHSTQEALPDPFTVPEGEDENEGEPPNPDDASYEPHDFIDDGAGNCVECNQTEDAAVHSADQPPVTS